MQLLLTTSMVMNLCLAVLIVRRSRFYSDTVKYWFRRKPDFPAVEATVRSILAQPRFQEWFSFREFIVHDEWMADVDVTEDRYIEADSWQIVYEFVTEVSQATHLPCWCYKIISDSKNPKQMIGHGFGIGYPRTQRRTRGKKKTT